MISLFEAQSRVDSFPVSLPAPERILLTDALGRVLAEDLQSDQDLPPFDRITMDGYAIRAADLTSSARLPIAGEVAAGSVAPGPLPPAMAYRVMTGAPLPPGADAIIMVEETRESGDVVEFSEKSRETLRSGQNIHRRGQDLGLDQTAAEVGTRITTASIPLLATLGCEQVPVFPVPEVAILTSGNELVNPSESPGPGQIRDSNRSTLAAQVLSAGCQPRVLPIVEDDPAAMRRAVDDGLRSDVLILTGGSSVGRYDYSLQVVEEAGAKQWFNKVAIKPGKPVLYLTKDETQVFCLPGNPVSAFVTFELLVRPALEKRLGLRNVWPVPLQLPIRRTMSAPRPRDLFQISRIVATSSVETLGASWEVEPIAWSGSGDLVSVNATNALVRIPMDSTVEEGQLAPVFPLRDAREAFPRQSEPCS